MNCRDFRNHLSLFLREELDTDTRALCEQHLKQCGECRSLLEKDRAMDEMLGRYAAREESEAASRLEGMEDRILERVRSRGLHSRSGGARQSPRRFAFRLSLAFNACALLVIALLLCYSPGFATRLAGHEQSGKEGWEKAFPEAQMRKLYTEIEALFGQRLGWVSDSGGEIAMGIVPDPNEAIAAGSTKEPVVALVYSLGRVGAAGSKEGSTISTVILTRPGHEVRQRLVNEMGNSDVEIAIAPIQRLRGSLAIQTELSACSFPSLEMSAPDGRSSLTVSVRVEPGGTVKLGQVRIGDRLYDAFLAVRILTGEGATRAPLS